MTKNNKPKEKLPCPVCQSPLDVRAFKNHVMNRHDYSRSAADEAFRTITGRESTSWKQMARNKEQGIHPSANRSDLPPMDTSDLPPSTGNHSLWFQQGFELGFKMGKESKQ